MVKKPRVKQSAAVTTTNEYQNGESSNSNFEPLSGKEEFDQGDEELDGSTSSEEEPEWTADDEKQFLKTLGALKGKREEIYDKNKKFWNSENGPSTSKTVKTTKDTTAKPMFLKDYERKVILEKNGKFEESDEEQDEEKEHDLNYYEQQEHIRKQLRNAVQDVEEDEDDLFLVKKSKSAQQQEKEDEDFYDWLKTQDSTSNPTDEELVSLKQAWTNANIDDDDKFLRDYLLNKDYVTDDKKEIPGYDEIVGVDEDEDEDQKQADYERKYNFRFEDPDQEFIKQYPRTVKESIRKDKTKRKEKRDEIKQRKLQEKGVKMAELKLKQRKTKSAIESKLEKLRRLAGDDIPLSIHDLQGDFDPAEYDRRMKELFEEKYYGEDQNYDDVEDDDGEKPVFSDMDDDDEEYDFENCDDEGLDEKEDEKPAKKVVKGKAKQQQQQDDDSEDVDDEEEDSEDKPKAPAKNEEVSRRKESRRKAKRKAKVEEAAQKKKPLFDPSEKTFEEYFNEYYALDFDDVIGDTATKFKYRQVVPNNFGLSTEEILEADEKQLNAWCSLKKATAYRSEEEEKYDLVAYERKAKDVERKKKLFGTTYEGIEPLLKKKAKNKSTTEPAPEPTPKKENARDRKKKKLRNKRKNLKNKKSVEEGVEEVEGGDYEEVGEEGYENVEEPLPEFESQEPQPSSETPSAGKKTRTRKRKAPKPSEQPSDPAAEKSETSNSPQVVEKPKKPLQKKKSDQPTGSEAPPAKRKKFVKIVKSAMDIDDDRLKAYGLNPKKFKAKLQYGGKTANKAKKTKPPVTQTA